MRCGWQARREKRDRQMMMGALGTFGTVVRDLLLLNPVDLEGREMRKLLGVTCVWGGR